MELDDIFPKDLITEKVAVDGVVHYSFGSNQIDQIVSKKKSCMFELGGTIWDKYVQSNPSADPMAMSAQFQAEDPYLYREISEFIGEDTVKNIRYFYSDIPANHPNYGKCGELLVSVLHNNVLHISDIEFSNPNKPIPESDRKYTFQFYKGLGIFEHFLTTCITYCKQEKLVKICLTAAALDLVPFFEKFGFEVDDTPTGKLGLQIGQSIPMTLVV